MSFIARLNMMVEGQTEETFVRDLLQEPLAHRGVYVQVRCVATQRRCSRVYRGGLISYAKVQGDMRRWLSEDKTAYLTTMFDLYKLPADFPGFEQAKNVSDPYQKVSHLEACLTADIADSRFIWHSRAMPKPHLFQLPILRRPRSPPELCPSGPMVPPGRHVRRR